MKHTGDYELDEINMLEQECADLEEENKRLENENIRLKSDIDAMLQNERWYKYDINKLEEEIKTLKECNKSQSEVINNVFIPQKERLEEENKKLKKERDLYKARNEELNENCFWLAKENENLKSDLSECECSMHFENDEVWFWKLEYKRLKKWIKDHCNWYWNLFPEDEMKRQWKKADKKRKLKWMLMEEDTLQELRDIGEI